MISIEELMTYSRCTSIAELEVMKKFQPIAEQMREISSITSYMYEEIERMERERKIRADILDSPSMRLAREMEAQQERMKQLLNPYGVKHLLANFESPIEQIYKQSISFAYREALERIQENHNRIMQGVIALRDALEHKKAKPPLILPRIFQSLNAWLSSLKAWIDLLIARTKHTEIFGIDNQDFEHFTIAAELF